MELLKTRGIVALVLVALGIGVFIGYFISQYINSTVSIKPTASQTVTQLQNVTQSQEELQFQQNSTQPQKEIPSKEMELKPMNSKPNDSKPTESKPSTPKPESPKSAEDKLRDAVLNGDAKLVEDLIKNPNLSNSIIQSGGIRPIHLASRLGDKNVIKVLLDHGVNINCRDATFRTPLHWSCELGHSDVVNFLIERGANMTHKDNFFWAPFHRATFLGFENITKLFLDHGIDVNLKTGRGQTALHFAASKGHMNIAKLLFEKKGVDVHAKDCIGFEAMHSAVLSNNVAMVEFLISKGADVNSKTNFGESVFHLPITISEEMAKILIANGADIDAKDSKGGTALHKACKYGNVKALKILSQNKADPNIRDNDGQSAYTLALKSGFEKMVELAIDVMMNDTRFQPEKWELAISKCIRPTVTQETTNYTEYTWKDALRDVVTDGNESVTLLLLRYCVKNLTELREPWPMHLAAKAGHQEIVDKLLCTFNVNLQDDRGNTALIYAAAQGHDNIVYLLLKKKNADVNIQNECGDSALHLAADAGFKNIVSSLLSVGAQMDMKNKNGKTPGDIAEMKGHSGVKLIFNATKIKTDESTSQSPK